MRTLICAGTKQWLLLTASLVTASAGCAVPDDQTSQTGTPDAGPPRPCTAAPSPSPFCTSDAGACPLLADDTITCPSPGILTSGLTSSEQVGLATAPAQRGQLAFATLNATSQSEYVELAAFDAKGAASFTVDTFAPLPYTETGGTTNAGLVVVSGPGGAPILLDTIGGDLRAAVGSAPAGGTFTTEQAALAPNGSGSEGWFIGGAGVEPGGAVDVLLQFSQQARLARRDPSGKWTSSSIPLSGAPAALALDAKGTAYLAGWMPAAASGMSQLELVVGSNAPVVLATAPENAVTNLDLTVGQAADGSPLPVVAYGSTLALAVPDGKGGFTSISPALAVAQPYQDGCMIDLSLGNCSCPSTCSQTGDQIASVSVVRDSHGNVYVAWLEVDANVVFSVSLNSTSVGNQMITCSCTPSSDATTDTSVAVGLQLDRLVMTPTPHTEHRGTIAVPADTQSLQMADGNGTLQLLTSAGPTSQGALRRVVLDAAALP